MGFFTLIILAVALGTDAFSLCLGIGMTGVNRRQAITITITVLIFHVVMPLAGWYIGELAGALLGRVASLIGAALLIYLGLHMIWDSRGQGQKAGAKIISFNAWGLILLGACVSMDALSVGFTLGAQHVELLQTAATIGLVAGIMTAAGLVCGRFMSSLVGERAQLFGGVVLIGIGVRLFF